MTLFLREADVQQLLTMEEALVAIEESFRLQGLGQAVNRPRQRLRTGDSVLMIMPAVIGGGVKVAGWKSYGSAAGGHMRVFLFSTDGEFQAIIEGNRLGQMRTGAASGVATKYLARAGAATVGIYGSGFQARTQLEAVCAVRPVRSAKVYSRSPEKRSAFASAMSQRLGVEVSPVERPEEAARGCDIVITITNAAEPVLQGQWLEPGTHVNAAGGNSLLRAELDPEAVGRAAVITADAVDQARLECADLLRAVERGVINWEQVEELGKVVCGHRRGRTAEDQITLFESHGLALWDVAAAAAVYRRARESGVGVELPF
ncbi:MAG: ornithine cyclodeaminase family protein [Chloroflexi bacterium]|nr:ornithine cyclodeaminase family protein [Chloroflexota bacterium]